MGTFRWEALATWFEVLFRNLPIGTEEWLSVNQITLYWILQNAQFDFLWLA